MCGPTGRKLKQNPSDILIHDSVKKLKRQVKSRIRASFKSQAKAALDKHQPKAAWKLIRKATFTQAKGPSHLPDIDKINNYFAELVQAEPNQEGINHHTTTGTATTNELFEITPLSVSMTSNLLRRVKADTTTGPDEFPAFLIKKLAHFLAPNITLLFNASISLGTYPIDWKKLSQCCCYPQERV